MPQEKGLLFAGALGLGGVALAALGAYFLTRKTGEIPLYTGQNDVIYTGKKQIAGVALQSIMDFVEIAYYYDPFAAVWKQITYDTVLEPGMEVNIKVTQDCIWTF